MTHVSIIGTGSMGQAIAGLVAKAGGTVELLGPEDGATVPTGRIVILAVPYPALAQVLAAHAEHLVGKVVVDITNPLDMATFDSLTVAPDASAAAELAAALPHSHVLKAFNTTFARTLVAGEVGTVPTTVLIAGDDAEAKALLAGVVQAAGLRAMDAGPLRRARELEALGFLQITLAASQQIAWAGGFAVVS